MYVYFNFLSLTTIHSFADLNILQITHNVSKAPPDPDDHQVYRMGLNIMASSGADKNFEHVDSFYELCDHH